MGFFRRLKDVISKGYYMTADGMQIDMHKPDTSNYHGNLIQGNADNYDKYFATFWYMYAHMYFADASVVRALLGPNRENFIEIDEFYYELKAGENINKRSSKDFYWNKNDRTTYTEMYKFVMLAYEGKYEYPMKFDDSYCAFPDRLILPRGWTQGMPMQFFFFAYPFTASYEANTTYDFTYNCGGDRFINIIDDMPLGYPFDLQIDESKFYVPNMYFKDVKIYHLDTFKKYHDYKYEHFGTFDYSYYYNN